MSIQLAEVNLHFAGVHRCSSINIANNLLLQHYQSSAGGCLTEPDVTLTDYGLAILCLSFVWRLRNQKTSARRNQALWILFFASIAAASLTGGTVHGFFIEASTLGYRVLWPLTLLLIGATTAAGWMLAGLMLSGASGFKKWSAFAALVFMAYAGVVLFYSQEFFVVVMTYVPAMAALFFATARGYLRTRARHFVWIAGGVLISFVAASMQYVGIAIHPQYFNHNSTYHIVQALALWVLFEGARRQLAYAGGDR